MLDQDHLALRLVRLKSSDRWTPNQNGLHFLFLEGGAADYVSGAVVHALVPGSILVLDGASSGGVIVPSGKEAVFRCFSLRLEHLFPLFTCQEISLLSNAPERFTEAKLSPPSSPLATQCHKLIGEIPPPFTLEHRGHLLRVASAILAEEFKTLQQRRAGHMRIEEHITQVLEQLSADDLLRFSVDDLASACGCGRRHLGRLFHQHFGFSVAALRMEMRLIKAISLLRDPLLKITSVAEQCAFNHLGLFNTCFRRRFGVSPTQWRQRALGAKDEAGGGEPVDRGLSCPLRINGLCPQMVAELSARQPQPDSATAEFDPAVSPSPNPSLLPPDDAPPSPLDQPPAPPPAMSEI